MVGFLLGFEVKTLIDKLGASRMKLTALTIAALLAASMPAFAEKSVYVCKYVDAAGFRWESGRWELTRFNTEAPFLFSAKSNSVFPESLETALGMTSREIICHPTFPLDSVQTCSHSVGGVFIFSFDNLNGAVAQTLGGSQNTNDETKDSLLVRPFVCTKM